MIKIVVESLDGYNTAKREFVKHNDIEWYTTSVGLIEKLRHKGVKISNLESGFPLDVQNKLGISAYSIANQITDAMNEYTKDWKGFIDFKMAFGQAITNLVYVYVYKGVLLDRQIDNNTNQVVCVGDCSNNSLEGLQLGVKRFDTIFALLAKNSDTNMFSVLDHLEDTNNLESLDNWVKTRPMGRLERILSIINNTPSSFFYKILIKIIFIFKYFFFHKNYLRYYLNLKYCRYAA